MKKIRKILFPTDFSETANHAIGHALRLAENQDVEVIVQHVVDDYFGPHTHWASMFDVHALQKELDFHIENEMQKVIPKSITGIKLRPVISKGKPDLEIVKLADKESPDLIVMGPAKSAVTNRVIGQAKQPVFSVPLRIESKQPSGIRRILVTTDFSDGSKRVLEYAFDLKDLTGGELYLLHAIETSAAMYFGIQQGTFLDGRKDTIAKMDEWAGNQLLNVTPQKYGKDDPSVHRLVRVGKVADVISAVAKEFDVDVVIVGTREHGATHQYLIGSTADKILRKVDAPLLTVRK
jgi:nucleotide-binding universal stress UspA family protein